jgi:hypothetical protein
MSLFNDLSIAGIITQQEAIELTNLIAEKNSKSTDILEILYSFFTEKITGGSQYGNIFVSYTVAEDQINDDQKNEGLTSKFLEILYGNMIIPEIVYQKIKRFSHTADHSGYFYILHLCREVITFYSSFTIEKQLAFATLLEGTNPNRSDALLDTQKKEKLIRNIKAQKLESYHDFFMYCYRCKSVNILSCKGKESNLLKVLKEILNELCYNAFTISQISSYDKDFDGEPNYHNKEATIVINTGAREHQYSYTFMHSEDKNHINSKLSTLLENVLIMANQLLAGYNATYRLTAITNQLSNVVFPGNKALYSICSFQAESIKILDFYEMKKRFLFHQPSLLFKFPLSYLHIEYAIYHFNKCGLFTHLSTEAYENSLTKIYKSTYNLVSDLLGIFPRTIATIYRTVSSGQKPYSEFLLALNQISNGVLNFTNILDGIPEDFTFDTECAFKVSFECNNEYHEVDCKLICQEFNDTLIYYIINEIIRKKYTQYRLLQLSNSDHTQDTYLFLTDHQCEYLQKMKLIETIDRF